MKAYFLSDLHLTSVEEPNTHRLLKFFRSLHSSSDISHLFLMGDIFDLWIAGHEFFVQKYSAVIEELRRLRQLGVEIHYFEGNHDLYLEHFYARELNLQVHDRPAYFQLGRYRVRVEHGDQMDPNDRGYRFLRWLLRTSIMQWLAPRLPSDFVVWLGERMSRTSREYTTRLKSISTERAISVIREHGARAYQQEHFDFLLCGHVHVKEDYQLPNAGAARVLNLGSWFDGARTVRLTEAGVEWLDL